MGRAPCCSKVGLHRGPWTPREDELLVQYIQSHGEGNWRNLPKNAGLLRCGKSCRLRWMNYLRPDIKRGNIGPDEEDLIIRLHALLGNRWSLIAGRLPGRTDNEIKNYWNGHLSKKLTVQLDSIEEGRSKPKSRRNKNGGRSTKKKEEKRKTKTKTETEIADARTEIYAPKATRIISIARMETSEGSDSNMGSTSSGDNDFGIDWSSVDQGSLFVEQDAGTGHAIDFDLFLEGNTFENLYQEYSQLLNSKEDQLEMFPLDERW